MIRVDIVGKYELSRGKAIVIKESNGKIYVGDDVLGDDGNIYHIIGINMPTRPEGLGNIGLI
ncbi:MAG: hypothetical protein IKP88_15920 [Lachnospiraceae bacterium]|nr:hypothetical protein [Lachnospiraceae bacterium]